MKNNSRIPRLRGIRTPLGDTVTLLEGILIIGGISVAFATIYMFYSSINPLITVAASLASVLLLLWSFYELEQ